MRDTKALFLVHHNQAQPFELDRLGQHGVRSNHNVYAAIRQSVSGLGSLGRGNQPRKSPDL